MAGDYKGDHAEIKESVNSCIDLLNGLVEAIKHMAEAQRAGDIDAYVPEDKFAGVWRQLAAGANEGVRLHVSNILKVLNIVSSYAEGDFGPVLEKLPGKQALANEKMDLLRNNLLHVSKELTDLIGAALNGNFATRAKTDGFSGDWKKLIGSINDLIEAFVKPIHVTADYVDKIGKGQIPPKITDSYTGDFNVIKNNLNACIDGLAGLGEATEIAGQMAVNDLTRRMQGNYMGIFADLANGINTVRDRVSDVVGVVKNVAEGNLTDLAGLKKVGRRSEQDELMPSFITMMENIQALVADACCRRRGWKASSRPAPTPASTRVTTAKSSRASIRLWTR
jgi:methyl-accepting chemotaxis protein